MNCFARLKILYDALHCENRRLQTMHADLTSPAPLRLLHLVAEPRDAEQIGSTLAAEEIAHTATIVTTEADFFRALRERNYEIILSDLQGPQFDGRAALGIAKKVKPEVPFVFVARFPDENLPTEMLRNGATDYVHKERLNRLAPVVRRATAEAHERIRRQQAEVQVREKISLLENRIAPTERKRSEGQLLRAQRMEAVGTLASGIAHDFNNILAPIMLAISLVRDIAPSSRETDELLATIEESAQRGASLVKRLLTFGRGAEGKPVPVNLAALIGHLANIIQATFPKDIILSVKTADELWPILGDPNLIEQVLLNLCLNARDAMPEGGYLSITAENSTIDEIFVSMNPEASPGPHVLLKVTDTGCGISNEILDKIFDPFFTTKELGHGTGLGLFTVHGIVKGRGGFLNVHTQEGSGSTFEVYWPSFPGPVAVSDEPGPVRETRGQGECILVADDEDAIRMAARMVLELHGYRVLVARDGNDALNQFVQHQNDVDLVLTDVMMPGMDGVALVRLIRKMDPKIKVIASSGLISGTGSEDRKLQLENLGVSTFLDKPYTSETLLATLAELLRRA
jgi:signal transduction histidine kinase/ActR/RegA family two-component response regulator